MTRILSGIDLAGRINSVPTIAAVNWNNVDCWIEPEVLPVVASFLKDAPDLDFAFLTSISAVDYIEYFELVYHLLSMRLNQSAVVKLRCYGREEPVVPSVVSVWRGADLQEREIPDLCRQVQCKPAAKREIVAYEIQCSGDMGM